MLALAAGATLLLATACASGAHRSTTTLPGAQLDGLQSFYVEHQSADSRNIHDDIRGQLEALGFKAASGDGPPPGGKYDASVTYIDRIMWDMSNYCLQLTIFIRDLNTGYIVATGSSYRPSMVRKTPAGHAKLLLTELFRGGAAE